MVRRYVLCCALLFALVRVVGSQPRRALPDCALLVYRHVQKTGGSTLRHFFRQQELAGQWEYYGPQGDRSWPETSNRVRLAKLLDFWEALESPVSNFSATPRRLLLEWHAEAHLLPPWERAVEVVSWLRRAAARRGCPVSLVTLLRHPVDIYPSWWRYEGLRMTRGQGLLQWVADNPNIQSTTLMAGVSRPAALPFATQMHEGRFDRLSLWDPRDAAALRLLLAAFDVIAPMERFEEAFFLLAERLGFQQLGFIRQNEGAKRDMWSLYRGNLSAVDEARMEGYGDGWAPHRDAPLVEAVNQSAAVDLRVYAHCVAAFERQIGALSSEAAARLRAFLDTPLEGQWKGERPQQIFEWRMARVALPGARRTLPRAVRNVSSDQLAVWSLVPIAAHEIHVDD